MKTKYILGEMLVPIHKHRKHHQVTCSSCGGTGRLTILETSEKINCKTCYGRASTTEVEEEKWNVCVENMSICGNIRTIEYLNKDDGKTCIQYMLQATGVGSGTLWYEDQIYRTIDEAQAECDKRNASDIEHKESLHLQLGGPKRNKE